MRKMSVLAIVAMFAAPALAATSTFSLSGTAAHQGNLPMETVVMGPTVFGGVLLEDVDIVDLVATGPLSANIDAPLGGVVDIFLSASVSADSAGLQAFTATITGDPGVAFTSGLQYDVPFRDVPGRMTTFSGFDTPLGELRKIAGPLTEGANGQFFQALTSPFAAATGASGNPDSISEATASGSSLVTTGDNQTFGIGQVGNDQTTGPTIVGHFTVEVPTPTEGDTGPLIYNVSVDIISNINWVEDPIFADPIVPGQILAASEVTTMDLTITVPEPTTALLLLPAAAIIRRRR
jgi:hypothetical protein